MYSKIGYNVKSWKLYKNFEKLNSSFLFLFWEIWRGRDPYDSKFNENKRSLSTEKV